jgi:hypothetical protein
MIRIYYKPQTRCRLILGNTRWSPHRPPTTCPGEYPTAGASPDPRAWLAGATVSGLLHPHVRQIVVETAIQALSEVFDTGPTAGTYPQTFVELAQRAGPLADCVVDIAFTHPVTDTDDHKLARDDPNAPTNRIVARMRTIRNSSVSVNALAIQVPDPSDVACCWPGDPGHHETIEDQGRVSTAS